MESNILRQHSLALSSWPSNLKLHRTKFCFDQYSMASILSCLVVLCTAFKENIFLNKILKWKFFSHSSKVLFSTGLFHWVLPWTVSYDVTLDSALMDWLCSVLSIFHNLRKIISGLVSTNTTHTFYKHVNKWDLTTTNIKKQAI